MSENCFQKQANRREFAAISLASIAALAGCKITDSHSLGAIDAHCHIWETDGILGRDKYPFEQLQAASASMGIDRFVVVVLYSDTNKDYVLKVKEQYEDKISIVGLLDVESLNLEKQMQSDRELGIRGYRLNSKFIGEDWLKVAGVDRMWEIAADLDVSMCLLRRENASIASIKQMLEKYRSTTVVIDHLGLVDPLNANEVSAFLSLAKYEKCNVKVSRFFTDRSRQDGSEEMLKLIEKVHAEFGSERLMWGSNAPVEVSESNDYTFAADLIRKATFLKPRDLQNIFRGTAERVFFG